MDPLRFAVQGSAATPYEVSAWGSGSELKLFCSCPAGRKAGLFCKHMAQVLVGEVTNLVSGAEHVVELAARALGTAYVAMAVDHAPRQRRQLSKVALRPTESGDVSEAIEGLIAELVDCGWFVERGPDGIIIYGVTPTGRRKSRPYGMLYQDEDSRMYCVNGVSRARSFKDLESAAGLFRDAALALDPGAV